MLKPSGAVTLLIRLHQFVRTGAVGDLRDTPTLGVRVRPVGCYVADRDIVTVETECGPMLVKRRWLGGEVVSAAAAREKGVGWSALSASTGRYVAEEETDRSRRNG